MKRTTDYNLNNPTHKLLLELNNKLKGYQYIDIKNALGSLIVSMYIDIFENNLLDACKEIDSFCQELKQAVAVEMKINNPSNEKLN